MRSSTLISGTRFIGATLATLTSRSIFHTLSRVHGALMKPEGGELPKLPKGTPHTVEISKRWSWLRGWGFTFFCHDCDARTYWREHEVQAQADARYHHDLTQFSTHGQST